MNPPDLHKELVECLPHLRRWSKRFDRREYDAESLVSDTIISLLQKPSKYDPARGSLRNLLFTDMKNKAVDFLKLENRAYRAKFRNYLRNGIPLYTKDRRDSVEDADFLKMRIERLLEDLPARAQTVFKLFAFDGKSYQEISAALGISYPYVKAMVHRARIHLRQHFRAA